MYRHYTDVFIGLKPGPKSPSATYYVTWGKLFHMTEV